MNIRSLTLVSAGTAACLSASAAVFAGTVPSVDVIAAVGQIPLGGDGSEITTFNPPFTNSLGQVGFTGNLASGERYVWHTDAVIWLNAFGLPDHVLTGTETTMGISDDGGFIYSPSVVTDDGSNDAVYTHNGLLLQATDPAPGIPDRWATFNSRPRMTPDGTAWWVAGLATVKGGSSTGRVLYMSADTSNPSSSVPVLTTLDTFNVGGNVHLPTNAGIGFNYDISDNSEWAINELVLAGLPAASNTFIWINGNLAHRQADPVGDGTNWNSFRGASINNSGDYTFGGATSGGPTATQEFLAYNGNVIVRRGDTLDGIELLSNWATRWTSINNLGHIAHIWEGGSGASLGGTLFVTLDGSDPLGSTIAVVSINQPLDTDGDGIADAVISDFKASAAIAPGLDFSDHPWVYVEVDLRDILDDKGTLGPAYEAIVRAPIPGLAPGTCPADFTGDGNVGVADLLSLLAAWGPCPGCAQDLTGDGNVGVADLLALLAAWGPCP